MDELKEKKIEAMSKDEDERQRRVLKQRRKIKEYFRKQLL